MCLAPLNCKLNACVICVGRRELTKKRASEIFHKLINVAFNHKRGRTLALVSDKHIFSLYPALTLMCLRLALRREKPIYRTLV
jgi:hypothetical protein